MLSKAAIKELLTGCGMPAVVSTKRAAEILGLSVRTINTAKNKGSLPQIDRNTFDIESVVAWLFLNPRYLVKLAEKCRSAPNSE